MKRFRRSAGFTIVEVVISTAIASGVLIGAGYMLDASNAVAQSTNDAGAATKRVGGALTALGDAMRRSSLASARHLDGSNFDDGTTDTGFQIRFVTGFNGAPVNSNIVTYRWELPIGATEGDLICSEGGVERLLASHVTDFSVRRAGNLFTFTLATRNGPQDDRSRAARGAIEIAARNP